MIDDIYKAIHQYRFNNGGHQPAAIVVHPDTFLELRKDGFERTFSVPTTNTDQLVSDVLVFGIPVKVDGCAVPGQLRAVGQEELDKVRAVESEKLQAFIAWSLRSRAADYEYLKDK